VQRVVVGALVSEHRVLLGHRSPDKRAYPDIWDLPGGVIEEGEAELDALARELHEELGVRMATGSASHLCRVLAGPPDEPALLSAWLVGEWEGTPANLAPEEHVDIGWFDLDELPPLAHDLVRQTLVGAVPPRSGLAPDVELVRLEDEVGASLAVSDEPPEERRAQVADPVDVGDDA
jgi:8-oxo-dGTP diphosphatase